MTQGMYLSFANNTGFLGAAFIPGAEDIIEACATAWDLGINPGGEVAALGPTRMPPEEWCGRLLSREDVEEFDRVMLGEPLHLEEAELTVKVQLLIDALAFYADPATYHAIFIVPEPPCGEFADDFSEDHGDDFYNRPMPGKTARAALAVWFPDE